MVAIFAGWYVTATSQWCTPAKARLTLYAESEAVELKQIREACLPEVLLAYTAVLSYSSQYLSRSYLLKSMELGATIAAPDSDLAECFVSSKRMPEMVDALAVTSMNMLLAEEYGIGNKKISAKMGLWTSKDS